MQGHLLLPGGGGGGWGRRGTCGGAGHLDAVGAAQQPPAPRAAAQRRRGRGYQVHARAPGRQGGAALEGGRADADAAEQGVRGKVVDGEDGALHALHAHRPLKVARHLPPQ